MPLAVTPWGASSRASENVRLPSPPFEVVYAVPAVRPPVFMASEQMLTILPHLRSRIAGTHSRHRRYGPSRVTERMGRQSSGDVSTILLLERMPALLTRMSTGPHFLPTMSHAAFTCDGSLTS